MDFYYLHKYTALRMNNTLDPDMKQHTLYFLGGFAAGAVGFIALLAGFFSDQEAIMYAGAVFICGAAAVQSVLLLSQPRPRQDERLMFTREPVSTCSGVLYADHLVTITGESITFASYSFPFAGSRTVAFSDIDYIMAKEPSLISGKWRIWGSGDLRIWFPFDIHRPSRDRIFVASLKSRRTRIGFTVEDSSRVIALLEEHGLLGGVS